jgi:hypothetical protein
VLDRERGEVQANDSGYSKGPHTDDTTEVTFRYGTGYSEYLGWMLIPKDTAYAAAVEFFRNRPTTHQC